MTTPAPAAPIQTIAEQSGFQITGRYEEVERLCPAYEARWPGAVRCFEYGRTPEGRPMLALVATRAGSLDPRELHRRGVPVIAFQGGIHPGEIEGKDAGFLALRELLDGAAAPGVLERLAILFVPVLNIDGHERFGRWNRPNQRGPEEMGWRTTSQNLNLNRDYCKADSPEMRALLRLLGEWDPILYTDLHATDGAQFEHDTANMVEPLRVGEPLMHDSAATLIGDLNRRLSAQGHLPLDFYPSLLAADDPASGFEVTATPARYSTGYWPLRNRYSILVETHSWRDYPARIRITRNTIVALAEIAATRGKGWLELAHRADDHASRIGGSEVVLEHESEEHVTMLDFRGYAYTREPSALSGALATRYDESRPAIWRVPLRDRVRPKVRVIAPRGGYVVPPAHAQWVSERLEVHGIEFTRVHETRVRQALESFRATAATFGTQPFEGRTSAKLEGEWRTETRDILAGSLLVPIAQPKAHLVLTLLEPRSPDSLASWGFFNAHFEQKEYMEGYVAEMVGEQMLREDPKLAEEFRNRLAEDAAFAASPAARLDFFYRRHPAWDQNYYLYPVYRYAKAL